LTKAKILAKTRRNIKKTAKAILAIREIVMGKKQTKIWFWIEIKEKCKEKRETYNKARGTADTRENYKKIRNEIKASERRTLGKLRKNWKVISVTYRNRYEE